eukprot:6185269-Pleurochrysis_carterae.AAC.2
MHTSTAATTRSAAIARSTLSPIVLDVATPTPTQLATTRASEQGSSRSGCDQLGTRTLSAEAASAESHSPWLCTRFAGGDSSCEEEPCFPGGICASVRRASPVDTAAGCATVLLAMTYTASSSTRDEPRCTVLSFGSQSQKLAHLGALRPRFFSSDSRIRSYVDTGPMATKDLRVGQEDLRPDGDKKLASGARRPTAVAEGGRFWRTGHAHQAAALAIASASVFTISSRGNAASRRSSSRA